MITKTNHVEEYISDGKGNTTLVKSEDVKVPIVFDELEEILTNIKLKYEKIKNITN